MDCSMSGLPVCHQLLEFTQTLPVGQTMSILTKGGYVCSLSGLFQPFQPLTLHSIDLARHALGAEVKPT